MKSSVTGKLFLGFAALSLADAGAATESIGVLSVAAPPGPTAELADLTGQLRRAMAERNSDVVDAANLRAAMTGSVPGASLGDLQRAYDVTAQGALARGDDDGALVTLTAILAELDRLPPGDEASELWVKATASLARVESDLGHDAASSDALARLVRRDPDVQLNPREYGPTFLGRIGAAKAALKAVPKVTLTVTSRAPGARVFVAGRGVGAVPAAVSLPAGTYTVVGVLGKVRTAPRSVSLAKDDVTLALDFTVPESLRPDAGPGLALTDAASTTGVFAAGAYLGLDKVVTARLLAEEGFRSLSGSLYDVRRGSFEREGKVRLMDGSFPPGGADALAGFLITGVRGSDLVEVPVAARLPTVAKAPPKPDLSAKPPAPPKPTGVAISQGPAQRETSALGWAAFGTGIATVGLATVAIWQGVESNSDYNAARSSGSQALVSSGDSARTAAIVTGVGAVVTGAATVVMGVIAGEIGPIRF